jgi:hypothetical protein
MEQRLLKGSVTICGIDCTDHDAVGADCSGDARRIEGRTYRRCRIRYEGRGDPEVTCVALDGDKEKFREAKDCLPFR